MSGLGVSLDDVKRHFRMFQFTYQTDADGNVEAHSPNASAALVIRGDTNDLSSVDLMMDFHECEMSDMRDYLLRLPGLVKIQSSEMTDWIGHEVGEMFLAYEQEKPIAYARKTYEGYPFTLVLVNQYIQTLSLRVGELEPSE